jgi:antitoxin (DNA-binding transcriptional repressor) of toxin-antitoxin stability system
MQVSIRELKANPAQAIELAQKGELVEITSHRKVVAELVRPSTTRGVNVPSDTQALERLVASGLAEPALIPLKLGRAVKLSKSSKGQSMSDLVSEMRGPR